MSDTEKDPIHLFQPTFRVEECLGEIRECLVKGWTGIGFKTVKFEEAWRAYTGLPHAHFLCSATAGLQIALRVLKEARHWEPEAQVITTPLTFVSTNHVIYQENLQPRFADVDEHLCMDPKSLEEMLVPWVKAVIFVGLGGNYGRLAEVARICKARGLALIVDAAHMAGTRAPDGRHVGFEADATVFSFQAVKNLPTADSGMICFKDPEHDAMARRLSWLGIDKDTYSRTLDAKAKYKWKYDVPHVGYKAHGNSVVASLGIVGLRYLDDDNERRREIANLYEEELKGIPEIKFVPMVGTPSRHLFQILVEKRDDLIEFLNSRKIYPGVHYVTNQTYPMYRGIGGDCHLADRASSMLVSLPMHLRLSGADVLRVCEAVKEFYLK